MTGLPRIDHVLAVAFGSTPSLTTRNNLAVCETSTKKTPPENVSAEEHRKLLPHVEMACEDDTHPSIVSEFDSIAPTTKLRSEVDQIAKQGNPHYGRRRNRDLDIVDNHAGAMSTNRRENTLKRTLQMDNTRKNCRVG